MRRGPSARQCISAHGDWASTLRALAGLAQLHSFPSQPKACCGLL